MQILLGAQSTLVKIQDDRKNFQHILNFIETQFERKVIRTNSIYIPSNDAEYHKRVFLMKWLYSYYSRKYTKPIPNLKNVLLARVGKPIHLHLPVLQKLSIVIDVFFIDKYSCQFSIRNSDMLSKNAIKAYFEGYVLIKERGESLYNVDLVYSYEKRRLKSFFDSKTLEDFQLSCHYDLEAYRNFFTPKKKVSEISKACALLDVKVEDPLVQIRKSYIRLAKKYHPDLIMDKTESRIKQGTQYFQTLLAAFDLIKGHKKVS